MNIIEKDLYITQKNKNGNSKIIINGITIDNNNNKKSENHENIKDFNLKNYEINNKIVLNIKIQELYDFHTNKKLYTTFDWTDMLNEITKQGYNVTLNIKHQSGNGFNLIDYIYKDNNRIKNKDKININIQNGSQDDKFSYLEYEQIDKALDLCAKDIKSQGLSPLEQVIAAYKVTMGMFGNEKINGENSYNITSSLVNFPNIKPVCQSYSGLFRRICEKLNIPCEYKSISIGSTRHAIDIVTIKDPKYNINGNYLFDVTLCHSCCRVLNNDPHNDIKIGPNPVIPNAIGIGMDNINLWSEMGYKNKGKVTIDNPIKISQNCIPPKTLIKANNVVDNTFIMTANDTSKQSINNNQVPKKNNQTNVTPSKQPQKQTNKKNNPPQVIIHKPIKKNTTPVKKDYKRGIEEIQNVSRNLKDTLKKLDKIKPNNQLNSMFEQKETSEDTETYIR